MLGGVTCDRITEIKLKLPGEGGGGGDFLTS